MQYTQNILFSALICPSYTLYAHHYSHYMSFPRPCVLFKVPCRVSFSVPDCHHQPKYILVSPCQSISAPQSIIRPSHFTPHYYWWGIVCNKAILPAKCGWKIEMTGRNKMLPVTIYHFWVTENRIKIQRTLKLAI